METELRSCANPDCKCPAPSGGDYCSDYCQFPDLGDQTDYDQPIDTGTEKICNCDHAECNQS